MVLRIIWKCIFGPRLYRLIKANDRPGFNYKANNSEIITDGFIKLCTLTWNITIYTSPIILAYFYKKYQPTSNNFLENYQTVYRSLITLAGALAGVFLVRGISRYNNPDYREFIIFLDSLSKIPRDNLYKFENQLNKYDFDFKSWPIFFKWADSKLADPKKPPEILKKNRIDSDQIKNFPLSVLSYLAIKLFGRRMMYPGSVDVLQKMMDPVLTSGRIRLVEHYLGKRYKLLSCDGNEIDTMFIDNRNKTSRGNILIICCEGNAGFYEVGITTTSLSAGYSTLGWNHPGFGGSTGEPYPQNEVNAADTVMKFAIDKLNFKPDSIIIFGWSIGGYPASWIAKEYPDIKGLVLDATFDDVVDLAVAKMPAAWKPLVIDAVSTYFNLNVSEQLNYYNGPVLVVRRTMDEIINTNTDEPVKTNRANEIILKLLKNRFPNLLKDQEVVNTLTGWLKKERSYFPYYLDKDKALLQLKSYVDQNRSFYPIEIGDDLNIEDKKNIILYIASKTLVDFNTTHCTPLDTSLLQEPWDIFNAPALKRKL